MVILRGDEQIKKRKKSRKGGGKYTQTCIPKSDCIHSVYYLKMYCGQLSKFSKGDRILDLVLE